MSAFILIVFYAKFELSYDTFHHHSDRIYRLKSEIFKNNEPVQTLAQTYPKVGPTLKDDFEEVEDFSRLFPVNGGALISANENHYNEEGIFFVDPSFFKMFSYHVEIEGVDSLLTRPNTAVITTSVASKYFGKEDAVGKLITFHWFGNKVDFLVENIVEDPPENTHLKFNILLSYATLNSLSRGGSESSWGWNNFYTYLLLAPGVNVESLEEKFKGFVDRNLRSDQKKDRFLLQPVKSIHLQSNLSDELEPSGNQGLVYLMMLVALFILVIAWINYINLSIAQSSERAKEVAIRKVNGAQRATLVAQFLSESLAVNLLAMTLTIIVLVFSIPLYHDLTGITLTLAVFKDSFLWVMVAAMLTAGVLASGLYPALVISSFKPVRTLAGGGGARRQFLRNAFVTFQYASAAFLIVCIVTVFKQIIFLKKKDLAVNIENILVVKGPKNASRVTYTSGFNRFRDDLESDPSVNAYASSSAVPGISLIGIMQYVRPLHARQEEANTFYGVSIDSHFISTYNLEIVAGRNFSENFPNESQSIIFNEAGLRLLGFYSAEDAINKTIIGPEGTEVEIVGVVKNFHQLSPHNGYYATYYQYSEFPSPKIFYSIRVNNVNAQSLIRRIEQRWNSYFPGSAFEYFFLDDFFNEQYKKDVQFGRLLTIFTIIAIFITCLGFFALISFNISLKAREIGIRKVLGASPRSIAFLFFKDFLKLIIIGNIIAWPIAYLYLNEWLSNFAFKIDIGWVAFGLSLCLLVIISFVTVGATIFKATRANLVDSLRENR